MDPYHWIVYSGCTDITSEDLQDKLICEIQSEICSSYLYASENHYLKEVSKSKLPVGTRGFFQKLKAYFHRLIIVFSFNWN